MKMRIRKHIVNPLSVIGDLSSNATRLSYTVAMYRNSGVFESEEVGSVLSKHLHKSFCFLSRMTNSECFNFKKTYTSTGKFKIDAYDSKSEKTESFTNDGDGKKSRFWDVPLH